MCRGRRMEHKIIEINYPMLRPSRGLIPGHFNMRQREGMISQETQENGDSETGQDPERDTIQKGRA